MNVYDLVIIAPERAEFRRLMDRFSDPDELVEIHLERRKAQRRRASDGSVSDDRRRRDRRSLDVSDSLRTAGFALIPASQRP